MLQKLDLSGIPCFGTGSPMLEPLSEVTLLYGPNGSGKSSIAVTLSAELRERNQVLLYGRRYIDSLLEDDASIEGVFTIRDADQDTLRRLKQLLGSEDGADKKSGELPKLQDKIKKEAQNLGIKKDDLERVEGELAEELWPRRNALPEELKFAFDGTGNSKKTLRERTLKFRLTLGKDPKVRSLEALVSDARALMEPVPETKSLLPDVPQISVLSKQAETLLLEPITGREDTSFAEFVEKLGNRDWVAAGREPFSRSGGQCPFCQQEAPADLQAELDSLFDAHYEDQIDKVRALLENEQGTLKAFQKLTATVKQLAPENEERILQALQLMIRRLEARVRSIETKIEHPSDRISLESLEDDRARLVSLFESANREAERIKRLLANRSSALEALKAEIWTYFVIRVAASSLAKFDGAAQGPQQAINSLKASLAKLRPQCEELEDEVKRLEEQQTSPLPTVRKINGLLRSLGFLSFKIEALDDDMYRLVRHGGEAAHSTLSEGERTLVSFLYFYFRALQESYDRSDGEEVVIILDDPVSSLDSDSLFVISLLTRRLFSTQVDKDSSLAQVFLLTHNAYFYKEAVYVPHKQKPGRRSYLVLSKDDQGVSRVQHYASNPIESTYALLWVEVQEAARAADGIASVSLPNSMRRILENYFRLMGGVAVEQLVENVPDDEKWAQAALLSWTNDGSHSAPWDLSFAGTQFTNKALLKAFKEIFVETDHIAHYQMMMREAGELAGSS